ncbi:hypothetical protein [Arthrobacter methylotrophus]|uniref:hypothetical protein n=1 Tax=Arthrobacter methylotrophus TaxID=121291 RepID=UPI0031E664A4
MTVSIRALISRAPPFGTRAALRDPRRPSGPAPPFGTRAALRDPRRPSGPAPPFGTLRSRRHRSPASRYRLPCHRFAFPGAPVDVGCQASMLVLVIRLCAGQSNNDDHDGEHRQDAQPDMADPSRSLSMRVDIDIGHGRCYFSGRDDAEPDRLRHPNRSRWTENISTSERPAKTIRPLKYRSGSTSNGAFQSDNLLIVAWDIPQETICPTRRRSRSPKERIKIPIRSPRGALDRYSNA